MNVTVELTVADPEQTCERLQHGINKLGINIRTRELALVGRVVVDAIKTQVLGHKVSFPGEGESNTPLVPMVTFANRATMFTCATCRYFEFVVGNLQREAIGLCHRYPPTYTGQDRGVDGWEPPTVSTWCACGEYKKVGA